MIRDEVVGGLTFLAGLVLAIVGVIVATLAAVTATAILVHIVQWWIKLVGLDGG